MTHFIREACVETLQQALSAESRGADRVELCSCLDQDGLTPSENLISEVKEQLHIPVRVMIRPRPGNFIYSEAETAEMKASVEYCKKIGVEGVVFGILKSDGTLDIEAIKCLIQISQPFKVVIHKAIDKTPQPLKAFKELCKIDGITTVLTSGGAKTAVEGEAVIKEMISIGSGKIEVMPAGKITNINIHKIHQLLGAGAYHGKYIVGTLG